MRTFAIHIWTSKDVAHYLGINVATVFEWLKKGYLPQPKRFGKAYRWNAALIQKRIPKEWINLGLNQLRLNMELRICEQFKTAGERRAETKHIHDLTDDLNSLAKQKERIAKSIVDAEKAGQTLGEIRRRDLFAAHALSGLLASGIYERELARSKPTPGWEVVNFNEEYFSLLGTLVREYTSRMIEITEELPNG
jgi:predicted DNA-binding transcriptional regulator AlpA